MKKLVFTSLLIFSFILNDLLSQQTVGLFLNESNAYNGYILFPTPSDKVYLIDNCGKLINEWQVSAIGYGTARLLSNGDLLKSIRVPETSFSAGGGAGKIERYSWEGMLLWEMEYNDEQKLFHHDFTTLPNGNILFIAWEQKSIEDCQEVGRTNIPDTGLWSETIVEIQPMGTDSFEIVWKWDMWDHLIQDVDNTLPNFGTIADNPYRLNVNINDQGNGGTDWLHFNAINYNEELDQIIVSSRELNEIFIIDHSTTTIEASSSTGGNANRGGDLLFRWGNPINFERGTEADQQLYGQHNAQWIPADYPGGGQILVFNNGAGIPDNTPYSSIVQLAPSLDNYNYNLLNNTFLPEVPSWEYKDNPPTLFYSSRISSTQRLPNGNTLINEGQDGRFFEVDPNGIKVWEYINPVGTFGPVEQTVSPNNNSVFTMRKYAPDYEGLSGRDLTSGDPIEINPYDYNCTTSATEIQILDDFQIINPVVNDLIIKTESQREYNVLIFDLVGNLLINQVCSSDASVDVSLLKSSIYILRIDNSVRKILILN